MNDIVLHSGVKGQKHGIRKWQNEDGTWTEAGKARRRKMEGRVGSRSSKKTNSSSSDSKPKTTSIRRMSNEELSAKIEHLKLEKQYRELQRDSMSRASKFVADTLQAIGKNALENIGSQALTHALGTMLNKAAGIDVSDKDYVAKRIANPQKGQGSDGDNYKKEEKKD